MALLEVEHLHGSYGEVEVLHDVSLSVSSREVVVVLGSNGAGKTSLLRAISGVIATRGQIRFDGRPLQGVKPHARAGLGIVHVPEGRGIFPYMTVLENLDLGAYPPKPRVARGRSLDEVFEMFPILRDRRRQRAGSLSGGEQQMLAIGRGLMAEPRVLMLDEPSIGLAPKVFDQIVDAIQTLNEKEMAILLVEQTVQESLEIASRAYVLDNGAIALSGTPEELLATDLVRSTYLGLA